MTELHYLSMGYGLFVLLIIGEALYGWARQRHAYRIGEAIVNVGHGMVFQVADLFTKALFMAPFLWVSSQTPTKALAVDSWWAWIVGLFAYDFCGYWRHRHHHEINFLWAVHKCHHAAEDFNFAAALRQALFGGVLGWLWSLPLALIMPFEMFVGLIVFDYLYQFVQHTRHVPKLGPIEWLFNTPSHHRVHHGTETKYLDRNYGGILITWDRLFGTFQVEEEEPTYGVTRPLGTLNAVWANLVPWRDLWAAAKRTSSRGDAWRLWVVGPDKTADLAPGGKARQRGELANGDIPAPVARYVVATFTANVAVLVALIWTADGLVALRTVLALLTVVGAVMPSAILERKRWAWPLEGARIATLVFVAALLEPPAIAAATVMLSAALAVVFGADVWLRRMVPNHARRDAV